MERGYYRNGIVYGIYRNPWIILPFLDNSKSYPLENSDIDKPLEETFVDFTIFECSELDIRFNEDGVWSRLAKLVFPFERIK